MYRLALSNINHDLGISDCYSREDSKLAYSLEEANSFLGKVWEKIVKFFSWLFDKISDFFTNIVGSSKKLIERAKQLQNEVNKNKSSFKIKSDSADYYAKQFATRLDNNEVDILASMSTLKNTVSMFDGKIVIEAANGLLGLNKALTNQDEKGASAEIDKTLKNFASVLANTPKALGLNNTLSGHDKIIYKGKNSLLGHMKDSYQRDVFDWLSGYPMSNSIIESVVVGGYKRIVQIFKDTGTIKTSPYLPGGSRIVLGYKVARATSQANVDNKNYDFVLYDLFMDNGFSDYVADNIKLTKMDARSATSLLTTIQSMLGHVGEKKQQLDIANKIFKRASLGEMGSAMLNSFKDRFNHFSLYDLVYNIIKMIRSYIADIVSVQKDLALLAIKKSKVAIKFIEHCMVA